MVGLFTEEEIEGIGIVKKLKREAFRFQFQDLYQGVPEGNFEELYKRIYGLYAKNSKLIKLEPAPVHPDKFTEPITDYDLERLESDVATMFEFGLNAVAGMLDSSAGRMPLPRDSMGEGSYEESVGIIGEELERRKKDKQNLEKRVQRLIKNNP